MDFAEMRRRRRRVLKPEYSADSPQVCAMGVVRAAGKFLRQLALSTRDAPLGTDYRPAVVEALGDMLMYCCGVADGAPTEQRSYDCAECAAEVLRCSAAVIAGEGSPQALLTSMYALCDVCAVDVAEAFEVSLGKAAGNAEGR